MTPKGTQNQGLAALLWAPPTPPSAQRTLHFSLTRQSTKDLLLGPLSQQEPTIPSIRRILCRVASVHFLWSSCHCLGQANIVSPLAPITMLATVLCPCPA